MSHNVCPHCESTNSIETAGQRYCADCGQLLSDKKVVTKPEKKKASKPKVAAIAQKAPSKPRRSAPPLNLKAIDESRSARTTAASRSSALDLRQPKPKPVIKKPIGKHVPPVKPKIAPRVAPALVAQEPLREATTPQIATKFRHKNALRDAFKSLTTRPIFLIAIIAALITTICEAIFVVRFAKTGMYAISQTIAAGSLNTARGTTLIGHLAWASLLGFVGYLVYHYAMAEIIFRISRLFDRRSAKAQQARRAALGSLAGLFIIDLLTWMFAIISLALVVGANVGFLGTKSLGIIGIILAVLTNAIVAYIWLGLIAARHMASYAIVLGQVGVRRAYTTGWSLYNRQFGLITSGLLLVVLVSFVLALPASILRSVIGNSTAGLVVSTMVTAITQAILLIIGSVYFLRLYRYVVAREYDSELGHLLTGRQPQQSHVKRRLIALSGIAVLWVIVSVALIISASPVASAIIH